MKRLILLLLFPVALLAQTSTITWTTIHQTMDGFGAEDWCDGCGTFPPGANGTGYAFNSTQAAQFWSTSTGIGLEWIRTGNYACPETGSCTVSTTTVPNLSTLQGAVNNGAQVQLDFGSPPASLKYTNSFSGTGAGANGTCIPNANWSAYATFIIGWIQFLNANSVPVAVITVSNESNLSQADSLGGCAWTGAQLDSFISGTLGPALATANWTSPQSGPPSIGLPQNSNWYGTDLYSACFSDTNCRKYVKYATGHGYTVGAVDGTNTGYCCITATAVPSSVSSSSPHIWMTEVNGGYNGYNSSSGEWAWDATIADAMWTAHSIHDYLVVANASLWNYWELVDYCATFTGCTPFPTNSGMAIPTATSGNIITGSLTFGKKYYAIGNWSKFVRSGWVRIDATTSTGGTTPWATTGPFITAFKNSSTGQFAIVALNTSTSPMSQTFSLGGFPPVSTVTPVVTSASLNLATQSNVNTSGSSFSYSLPAQSIVTFTGTVSSGGGSACPAQAAYNPVAEPGFPLTTLGAIGGVSGTSGPTTCYYIAASGSDSNAGTKASPWAHLPGMPTYTGTHTPVAGDGYILKGGDTWGAANFSINWIWPGSPTQFMYIGVDNTFFTGSSWTRPIWTCGNTMCGGGNFFTFGGNHNASPPFNFGSYVILDNIEMTGMQTTVTTGSPVMISMPSPYDIVENVYIHGWSHNTTAGQNPALTAISAAGTAHGTLGNVLRYNVIDGADTTQDMLGGIFAGAFQDVYGNYVGYATDLIDAEMDNIHDNIAENLVLCIAGCHQDNIYQTGEAGLYTGQQSYFYNNIVRGDTQPASAGSVKYWLNGNAPMPTGWQGFFFGNLLYNTYPGNTVDLGSHWIANYGTWNIFNNTIDCGTDTTQGDCSELQQGTGPESASATTLTIGTGLQTLVVSAATAPNPTIGGKIGFCAGSASNPDTTHCMTGTVTSWSSPNLTINVTSTIGTGTFSNWIIGGQMTVTWTNNHYISTGNGQYNCWSFTCNNSTNLIQTLAAANAQGYSDTQAFAFSPTNNSGATVTSASTSITSLCNSMVNAVTKSACQNGTSYACTYVTSGHKMSCPALAAVARPANPNLGAYQFSTSTGSPIASLSPTSLSFGTIKVTSSSTPQNIVLSNTGTAALTVSGISLTGANPGDYSFTTVPVSNCGGSVSVGGSCTIQVTFTPTTSGSRTATVSVSDNAAGSPQTATVSGSGVFANAPNPVCTPGTGTYSTPPNPTVSCTDIAPVMCYTLDGSLPSTNGIAGCSVGNLYSGSLTFSVTTTLTITAGGTGYSDSSPAIVYMYTINPAAVAPVPQFMAGM